MQQVGFDQSFDQRLAKVDLTKVMAHVAEDTGFDTATLARAEDLYRKFLTLKGQDMETLLVPPAIVDLVWHAHITFTRQYMADCEMLFGQYLHHEAKEDEAETTSLYNTITVEGYKSAFGINLYASGLPANMSMAARCGG